jgi:hypothetical protein
MTPTHRETLVGTIRPVYPHSMRGCILPDGGPDLVCDRRQPPNDDTTDQPPR